MVGFIDELLVALFWMIVNKNLFYNNLDLLQSSIDDVGTQWIRNKQHSRHEVQVRETKRNARLPKASSRDVPCKVCYQQEYILLAEAKIKELI